MEREDGAVQVAYAGHRLHYFARDEGGAASGQEVEGFGSEWYLVTPQGEPVNA